MTVPADLVTRYLGRCTVRELGAWGELLHDDVVLAADGCTIRGREAVLAHTAETLRMFPGRRAVLERVVAATDDTVVVEYRFANEAPDRAGWRLAGTVCDVLELRGERIAACESYYLPDPSDRTAEAPLPSRHQCSLVADEQTALRRVATIVARRGTREELFAAVAEESGRLVGARASALLRFDPDDTEMLVAGHRELPGAVRVPVTVGGRAWGACLVAPGGEVPFPAGTEARLAGFVELAGVAIGSVQARDELRSLLREQRALRSVATLVARGAGPAAILTEVARQACRVLHLRRVSLVRHEDGRPSSVVATHETRAAVPNALPAAAVEAAVFVSGRRWGTMSALPAEEHGPEAGLEERLAAYADLIASAIANTESHEALVASRARIVAAADESRRQIQRDLHDGAQQRLVHTMITLQLARAELEGRRQEAAGLVRDALEHVERATMELRELVHGIIPPALEHGGLRAAVASLLDHLALPVEVDVPAGRVAPDVERTAYFAVAEALGNVAAHAGASAAAVRARTSGGVLTVEVGDDGRGGADPARGSGLVGLADRVAAGGGSLVVESPRGRGTRIVVRLPVAGEQAAPVPLAAVAA